MCFHSWKEYKDIENDKYYRICTKCGIAQSGEKVASLVEIANDSYHITYKDDASICRTNNWISREVWKLRYGK